MSASRILAIAALAAAASMGAHAGTSVGEGDNQSPYALQFTSTADRGAIAAGAVQAARYAETSGEGDRLSQFAQRTGPSSVSRAAVREEAISANRAGRIEQGEATEG